MSRVVHFEIQAAEPDRTMKFYGALFGWRFTRWEAPQDYWLITTGPESAPGIDGGLMRRTGAAPVDGGAVNAYVCTVACDDVDAVAGRIPALGGSLAVPKMAVPGIGWLAYAKDPEGNIFGFMHLDPTAG